MATRFESLKEVFEGPDYLESMRRKCLYRSLRVEESFADYYQDKVRLQRFIFPAGTTHRELIKDIITGLPLHMKPLILANITPNTTLFDFRRVLIELEPALRNRQPRSKGNNNYQNHNNRPFNQSEHNSNANTRNFAQSRESSVSASSTLKTAGSNTPRNACFNCGGMHWRSECPNPPKNSGYSSGSYNNDKSKSYASTVNKTPLPANKWDQNSRTTSNQATKSSNTVMNAQPRQPPRSQSFSHTNGVDRIKVISPVHGIQTAPSTLARRFVS
jgi:hypothetical protein